jgi:spore coat polysaccharide biosynthesis protein SpsF (cytidylyltransferase family)
MKKKKTVAIVQARMSSSRLPGKVLKEILGKTMLEHQLRRIQSCKAVDQIVLATSTDVSDDKIADLCAHKGFECYRGSLDDVLERYYKAAECYEATDIVRLTGDCPLIDPGVIDAVIEKHFETGADYSSNVRPPSFPDGMDVEVMQFESLKKVWELAKLPSEREHVTQYFHNHPQEFKMADYHNKTDLSALRLTVDEEEDFELVKQLFENLYPVKADFDMMDILNCLEENPGWSTINQMYSRNEGLQKSRELDE